MSKRGIGRRDFLQAAGLAALGATGIFTPKLRHKSQCRIRAEWNGRNSRHRRSRATATTTSTIPHAFQPLNLERSRTHASRNTVCFSGGSARLGT